MGKRIFSANFARSTPSFILRKAVNEMKALTISQYPANCFFTNDSNTIGRVDRGPAIMLSQETAGSLFLNKKMAKVAMRRWYKPIKQPKI